MRYDVIIVGAVSAGCATRQPGWAFADILPLFRSNVICSILSVRLPHHLRVFCFTISMWATMESCPFFTILVARQRISQKRNNAHPSNHQQ